MSTFVRYIGPEGCERRAAPIDRMEHGDAVHSDAVRLLWSIAEDLHFAETIDKISGADHGDVSSPGNILTVWAINRVLDPMSATKLERGCLQPNCLNSQAWMRMHSQRCLPASTRPRMQV